MALVQPTNLFPSSFRGSGGDVIDASVENTFSLQLNGSSPCVAYSMKIMQNDTASTVVYTKAKTALATPIYPRNYLNEPQRLSITVPSNSGMTNGYANGYKWEVTLYWSNSDSITSADTFFLAQATPYFTIADPPTTVVTKSVTLTATYTQADGIPLEWYRWVLVDSNDNIIADTGEIYSEDIQFTVDGLLDGETFTYTLTGQTQSGVTVGGTTEGDFTVSYDSPIVESAVAAHCNPRTGAIALSFTGINVIQGTSTGTVAYVGDTPIDGDTSLRIASGGSVTFDEVNGAPMALSADATHIWSGRPDAGTATLYTFTESTSDSGTVTGILSVSNGVLIYRYGDAIVLSDYIGTSESLSSKWFIAIMKGIDIVVQVWNYSSLYPSETLYPSGTLYPGAGAGWQEYGRYSNSIHTIIIGTTVIGTMSISSANNLTFSITAAGQYEFIFTDYETGNPIRDSVSGTYAEGDSFTIQNPSNSAYTIFCTAYDGDGRFIGTAAFRMNSDAITYDTENLTSIVLNGAQTTDYVKVISSDLTDAEMEEYLDIFYTDYDKSFDVGTLLFAKFENNLEAGNYATGGEAIVGWDAYKQETGATNLQFVASLSLSQTSLIDALVENGRSYTYYLFPLGLDKMGSPIVSDAIVSTVWNYVLFTSTPSESDSNILYVNNAYIFQANVETGSIGNNASSSVMNNFTQYPKIIKGTQNYKSGKLSALVGYVDTQGGTYTETSALRDALYALSISQDRMFLKTRSGDIWEVTVHNAVNMDIADPSSYQPHTASIEWTEVAAISGVSLIYEGV